MAYKFALALLALGITAIFSADAASFRSKYDASAKLDSAKLAVNRFKSASWGFMDAIPLWLDMATILRFLGDFRFIGLLEDADVYTNLSMAGKDISHVSLIFSVFVIREAVIWHIYILQ